MKTKRNKVINQSQIVQYCLIDNEKGIQQLITWFLNDVMKEEGAEQAVDYRNIRDLARGERIEMNTGNDQSIPGTENLNSSNPK